jgi:hypothetical protein
MCQPHFLAQFSMLRLYTACSVGGIRIAARFVEVASAKSAGHDSLSCRVNVCTDRQQRIVGLRHQGCYVFARAGTRVELDGQHRSILGFSE